MPAWTVIKRIRCLLFSNVPMINRCYFKQIVILQDIVYKQYKLYLFIYRFVSNFTAARSFFFFHFLLHFLHQFFASFLDCLSITLPLTTIAFAYIFLPKAILFCLLYAIVWARNSDSYRESNIEKKPWTNVKHDKIN